MAKVCPASYLNCKNVEGHDKIFPEAFHRTCPPLSNSLRRHCWHRCYCNTPPCWRYPWCKQWIKRLQIESSFADRVFRCCRPIIPRRTVCKHTPIYKSTPLPTRWRSLLYCVTVTPCVH